MTKPVILITGASGNIGSALCRALKKDYHLVGLDIAPCKAAHESAECDLTSEDSLKLALHTVREKHGDTIAAVIHLAAYFDFTGEQHPLYEKVNVEGTRKLIAALKSFTVERFIYSGTMLVHEAAVPGRKVNEKTPLAPGWAYPQSKADAEAVIRQEHGKMPYTILRLAGLYDDATAVPTLSHQIARIYERDLKSHVFAGDLMAGQAFLHQDDMIDLFVRVVEARNDLPKKDVILAGEDSVMGYQALQNRIGELIYGTEKWSTFDVPELLAKTGAWAEAKAEPVIPDAIDHGEKPFIRAFMIDLASDHYDIDTTHVKQQLGWEAKHHIHDGLEKLVKNLRKDPAKWYEANGITPPDWVEGAKEKNVNADTMRTQYEQSFRSQHQSNLWAHFLNMTLAFWLLTGPFIMGYESQGMVISDMASGAALLVFSALSLSWRLSVLRWVCGLIGLWLLSAPLVFWAPTAAAYLNGTLVGMLVIGFSVLVRPTPGVAEIATQTGPTIPPGWDYCPSSWFQRVPIIVLAVVGFFISRYLCAYQLGHIDGVWEPFFAGLASDPQNGTEEIITSEVSEAWPVPDAGLGALTYALEIVTGIIGSSRRWRTMPWLVMLFGIMIVPLGVVSITFIIIQPIVIGTWCTLCLIGAAAMLIQIPYSVDELIATTEFLWRRKKQGRPLLRVFFMGDTDDGKVEDKDDSFEQSPVAIIKDMLGGGVTLPWNLVLCSAIGLWLMFTRLTLGAEGSMANADHIIGALVLTITITTFAESARAARFAILPFGLALLVTPFVFGASLPAIVASVLCGLALVALSIPKGNIANHYGKWEKCIV